MSWICLPCARAGKRGPGCGGCESSRPETPRERAEAAARSLMRLVKREDRDRYLAERPGLERLGVQA